MENEKKPLDKKTLLRRILLIVFGAVFIFSAVYVIRYAVLSNRASQEYDDYSAMLESLRAEMGVDPDNLPTVPESAGPANPGNKPILPEYAPFYALNQDLVGWIHIPETVINYPVMQTGIDNRDYYLKRTFSRKISDWGAIYVREECDVFKPSDNVTIYGHNMKDATMFTTVAYYDSQTFWADHRYVYFDTLYERHTYEVFAAFRTSGTFGEGFPYHMFVDAKDAAQYDQFVADVKALSLYDTGITPQYGEKLICLSTCEYTTENGRFVIVARQIS